MKITAERKIPFSLPDITEAEIAEVTDALRSGWITTGPKTKKLEQLVAERCGTPKAVCLGSNTACAEMTLRLLGVGAGDEVIVPAYTYTATASVVCHVGARPVMIDCEQGKFTMDYDRLEAAVTEKTKVIIPVDLFGIPCDYDRILDIAERKSGLFRPSDNPLQKTFGRAVVMADAAHSFGAVYKGKPAALFPDFTNFSFHAVKNLTTAEGGAVVWKNIPEADNDELYRKYMLLSLHGQSKDAFVKTESGAWEYDIEGPWFKCNMTDIHAAIGLGQIGRYGAMLARRRQITERYDKAFAGLPFMPAEHYGKDHESSGHLYAMRLFYDDGTPFECGARNLFIKKMSERGVAVNVHYKPLPMHSGYRAMGYGIEDFPNAYAQFMNEVTLPLHTLLTDGDTEYVIRCVKGVYTEILSEEGRMC